MWRAMAAVSGSGRPQTLTRIREASGGHNGLAWAVPASVRSASIGAADSVMVLPTGQVRRLALSRGSAVGTAGLNRTSPSPARPERECCVNAAQDELTCVSSQRCITASPSATLGRMLVKMG
jgi:hypothetical protein